MKHRKSLLCTGLLLCVVVLLGFSRIDDPDVIKKVATQLDKWSTETSPEKVYLHLDKPYYAIGDDIWFKAYLTTGNSHKLSAISAILNVELIDSKDSVKKAIKLPISSGLAWGDFKLTDTLAEGNYRIRAYTNWMRNAGDEYFFDKTIHIGNSINNTVFTKVNYTYSTPNNQQKVAAVVNYADMEGNPYTGKEVTYEVQLNNRQITKGKGITDNAGNLNLSFLNTAPAIFKNGSINTRIKLDAKQAVIKILPVKAASDKIDVQFFPESGYMVNGVRSRVAFKAVGADGLGVDVKGAIFDVENREIGKIETAHSGMGVFSLTPEAGKLYTAKLTYPDGSISTVNLPLATDKGYVLTVYNNPDADNITLKISMSESMLKEHLNSEISIVAQSGGSVVYAAKTKLESSAFASKILKSRFPSGIAQFTLFSATGEALNERVIFIQNPDQLSITLNTSKTAYSPREKAEVSIDAKNKDGKAIVGAFSIAVIDESKVSVDESSESTILSNILLTSDIKGYIEKPNYYFTNVSAKTQTNLDILMLTQGYRRFAWKQIMADVFPPLAFQPEKSMDISGSLKTGGGKPVPRGKVTLFSTSGGMFVLDTVTDDQGKFVFKNLVFTDSVKFVVQARTQKDKKNVEIELDNILPQLVTKSKNAPDIEVNISSGMAQYLQNSKKQFDDFLRYGLVTRSTFLKEVSISEKKAPVLKHSSNLNGAGNADQVIKSDQFTACATLSQCLLSKVNFVIFKNGMAYSTRSMSTPMLIVLDGMQMDPDFLDQIPPNNVESVEVLRSGYNTSIYGGSGAGGVLVITTKRGDSNTISQRYAPGIITYNPLGYYRAREFYSPKYDDPKTNTKVADLRTTIYWNPNIITNKSGKATVSFFNADTKGTYRAVIEGIDEDGNLGRMVYRYKVQ